MLHHFGRAATSSPSPSSPSETEVLGLLAEGPGQSRSRRRLGVSPKTVHNHASNIITKLHVSDRSRSRSPDTRRRLGRNLGRAELPRPLCVKKLECHHR